MSTIYTRGYCHAARFGALLCSAIEICSQLHDRSCAVGNIWRQHQAVLSAASVAVPEAARFCRAANFFRSPNQIIVPQRAHILAVVLMKLSLRVQNLVLPGVK